MVPLPRDLAAEVARLLAEWERAWGLPGLARGLTVEISPRLRRSAGRCWSERGLVRLARHVLEGDRATFREVLCHEVAHVAVHRRHGREARAHGREWRSLVAAAGFRPRTTISGRDAGTKAVPELASRLEWSHRCPVCQTVRFAARPVRRWRCRSCVEAGLGGRLEVIRAGAPEDGLP